jgi:hypothetical protein
LDISWLFGHSSAQLGWSLFWRFSIASAASETHHLTTRGSSEIVEEQLTISMVIAFCFEQRATVASRGCPRQSTCGSAEQQWHHTTESLTICQKSEVVDGRHDRKLPIRIVDGHANAGRETQRSAAQLILGTTATWRV